MTLQPEKVRPIVRTQATRTKALAQIQYALEEMAQKCSEASHFEWVHEGTQVRRYGDKREIVIRIRPWSAGVDDG